MVSMSRLPAEIPDEVAIVSRLCIGMAIDAAVFGLLGAALLARLAVSP
jgi:hypothetical protein